VSTKYSGCQSRFFTQEIIIVLQRIIGFCIGTVASCAVGSVLCAGTATGQEFSLKARELAELLADEEEDMGNFNLKTPTMGGKQFWTDRRHRGGWRIQRNIVTGHCRLLDANNQRRAWGSLEACEEVLQRHIAAGEVRTTKPHVVIVLHGLGRTRSAMQSLCDYLEEQGDVTTINVSYASTRDTVQHHAEALHDIMNHLPPEVEHVSFVAHSLGNIVIRHYLSDCTDPATGRTPDPRIRRMVMLGPPNNGAALAVRFKNNPLFRTLWGKSGIELAESFDDLQQHLAIPTCEFGIIAGGSESGESKNPLLDGTNDFVVTVEETRLPGATDFTVVPVLHSFLMGDKLVQEYVLSFLRGGKFKV
jgi:hypothetical protein